MKKWVKCLAPACDFIVKINSVLSNSRTKKSSDAKIDAVAQEAPNVLSEGAVPSESSESVADK